MHAQEQQSRPYPLITFNDAHFTGLGIFSRLDRVLISLNGASVCLSLTPTHKFTYRCEKLWSRDGRAVAVQFDSTAQVEITNFHWWNLKVEESKSGTWEVSYLDCTSSVMLMIIHALLIGSLYFCSHSRWEERRKTINSPCLHVHIRCFQAWGLCGPFLEETHKGHALDIKLVLQGLRTTKRVTQKHSTFPIYRVAKIGYK